MSTGGGPAPATSGSLILNAARSNMASALEQFCIVYWPPVFAFIRSQVGNREDARDLTQSFFAKLIEKHYLTMVSPSRGSFRSFLYASVRHFLSNDRDWVRAQKRGGGRKHVSLSIEDSEDWRRFEVVGALNPEREFERRWAQLVVERSLCRLRSEQDAAGNRGKYEVLKAFLTSEGDGTSIGQAAQLLGMNEPAVRMAIHRLRLWHAAALRAEVSETAATQAKVEDETRHLRSILSE